VNELEGKFLKKFSIFLLILIIAFIWGCSQPNKKIILPSEDNKAIFNNTDKDVKKEDEPKEVIEKPQQIKEVATEPQKNNESVTPQQTKPQAQLVKANSTNGTYFVMVDISEQRVYVYKDNELIREMICSTGIEEPETMTPRGQFIINKNGDKRGEWFYSKKYKQGAKYWVGFIGGEFLFHSVAMDENKNIIESEAKKLGTPASHGCIRMSVDDAYWFYKTIPKGTNLLIQD